MSVDLVTRRIRSEAGETSSVGSPVIQSTRREIYDVTVTDTGDTPSSVLQSPLVPQDKSPHPDGLYLRATERNAVRISPILFELTVDYAGQGNGTPTYNPLNTAPKIEYTSDLLDDELDRDINGNPIIMVTGEEFNPRIREGIPISIIRVTRNVTWVNPFVMEEYANVTNSDNWYGMAPGTCLIRQLSADSVETEDYLYWTVKAEIAIRRGARNHTTDDKAWYQRARAQGFRVSTKLFGLVRYGHAMDKGQYVTEPVLHRIYLDDGVTPANPNGDDGTRLGEHIKSNANAQWYLFPTKQSKPFAFLGLI